MSDPAVEQVREALPGYEVGGLLGRGAMGEVLAGRHQRLERDVAIKRLPAAFAADPDVRARFGHEAKVLASLSHPHIVPVYDYVERDGLCLLVMEALPGGTVWDRFTGAGLTMPTACAVIVATCAGLDHAHAKSVLHRDVKPDNLMFDADGGLKVTDFGIATVVGGGETLATSDGSVVGTPAYMAPEQADGDAVGPAADVYAAATMLYELLSGRLPFAVDETPAALLEARLERDPVPLLDVAPTVPRPLAAAVMAGLARSPGARPSSAAAFGQSVADAAAAAWGPAWADGSEVRLAGVAPSRPAPADPTGADPRATRITGERPTGDDAGAAATIVPGAVETDSAAGAAEADSAAGAAEADSAAGSPPAESPPAERVRSTSAGHTGGVDLAAVRPEDMAPVREVLRTRPVPWPAAVAAGVLLLLGVLVALGSLGGPDRDLPEPGLLRVAGADPATVDPVEVDLGAPIRLRVDGAPSGGGDAVAAELSLRGIGIPLGTSDRGELRDVDGARVTRVSLSASRILVSGTVTGEVRLLDGRGRPVSTAEVALAPDGPPLLSVAGVVGLLVLFGALAYAARLTRPLRSGRRRFSARLGPAGALVGVGLALVAWSSGGEEPTLAGLVVTAGLLAAAFLIGGWVLARWGRRRRIRVALR